MKHTVWCSILFGQATHNGRRIDVKASIAKRVSTLQILEDALAAMAMSAEGCLMIVVQAVCAITSE